MGRVSVRAGLNQGYLSAGLGFNLYALKLEFATYGEDTGDASRQQSRRYTATLALGWDAPPPAPITKAVVIEKEAANPKPAPLKEESLEPIIEKKETTDPKKKTN